MASTAAQALLSFPRRRPFAFGVGFSCVKTSLADFLVQKYVEKREELDVRRNLTFGLFGLGYLGGVQYALYVPIFGRLFPRAASFAAQPFAAKLADGPGQRAVLSQVVLDQCVHHPLLYFPAFYITREVVEHGASAGAVQAALAKYSTNVREDMLALWKLWVPVTCLNFAFSPMWLRIPVVATTSLAWTAILSAMRGASPLAEASPERAMDALGNAGTAARRLLAAKPALDAAKTHIVLTAAGQRRSGMLHSLSEVVLTGCGNVVESRAVQLGSDLTLMMLIEVDPLKSADLHLALAEHQRRARDVHLITRICDPAGAAVPSARAMPAPQQQTLSRFHLAAADRPGLVHVVTKFLASHGLDIMELKCEQREAFIDGAPRRLFCMDGVLAGDIKAAPFVRGLRKLQKEQGVTLEVAAEGEEPAWQS